MTPLFWKIALQVVSAVTFFAVLLLDYKWRDKRTNLFRRLRTVLFIFLGLSVAGNIIQLVAEAREHEKLERQIVNRIAKHLLSESRQNFVTIQLKGAQSWGLVTQPPPTDSTALRYELSILKVFKFATQVPKIWSADLKLLAHFGSEGERSHSALLRLYDLLNNAEKDEEELIRLIESEQRPDARQTLFVTLHE